jgi:hypothetical protein
MLNCRVEEDDVKVDVHKIVGNADYEGRVGRTGHSSQGLNACRIQGSINVNRVTGMLHITALGHGYLGTQHVDHSLMNFTHRIDRMSFSHKFSLW